MSNFININFPFKESNLGHFIDLNSNENQAIKADLLHLILTRKGQRLYKPDFGTDLLKFIFEPEDEMTLNGVKEEIISTVKKYLPQVDINETTIEESEEREYTAKVTIRYKINDGIFQTSDLIVVNI